MFNISLQKVSSVNKLTFMIFKNCFINRLLNHNYNDQFYDIFFSVGDIISLEVLRLENKFKSSLKHVTVHRYIGRVIARYNKGINSSFYNT